jgi:2-hydroxy-3-oxopropionate reductase
VLGAKAGVDPELVFEAIKGGQAGSTVLNAKAPMALARNIKPGFRINLHIKDLNNALAAGHEVGVPLPLTAAVMEIMQALKVDGMGEADHSAIIRYYEKLARTEVKKQRS